MAIAMRNFPPEIIESLRSYVYVYSDPRTGLPFYIGKGKSNRAFSHLEDESESRKVGAIKEIRDAGKEPRIDILRYGLSDAEANLVEAAAIDLMGLGKLTNVVRGNHSGTLGSVSTEDILLTKTALDASVSEPVILITINQRYRSNMTPEELYEATRGIWRVGVRRNKAALAMSVYQGIIREVYRIERWVPAGTLEYKTRSFDNVTNINKRWEFEGHVAEDLRDAYIRKSVRKHRPQANQNPILYLNC